MQEYRGGLIPLIHVDLYRLNDAREIDELGLEELGLNSVLAIEWAEKLPRPIAEFRPFREGAFAKPYFYVGDAFFLPFTGLQAMERGGPEVTVWALTRP